MVLKSSTIWCLWGSSTETGIREDKFTSMCLEWIQFDSGTANEHYHVVLLLRCYSCYSYHTLLFLPLSVDFVYRAQEHQVRATNLTSVSNQTGSWGLGYLLPFFSCHELSLVALKKEEKCMVLYYYVEASLKKYWFIKFLHTIEVKGEKCKMLGQNQL